MDSLVDVNLRAKSKLKRVQVVSVKCKEGVGKLRPCFVFNLRYTHHRRSSFIGYHLLKWLQQFWYIYIILYLLSSALHPILFSSSIKSSFSGILLASSDFNFAPLGGVNAHNILKDGYKGHIDVKLDGDVNYRETDVRGKPPELNPHHKEQILKQLEEEIRRQQPGADENQRIKLGNSHKKTEVIHDTHRPLPRPTHSQYKEWIKKSERKPNGYLDLPNIKSLFMNKFTKYVGLGMFIVGLLIIMTRYCEDRQRAYIKKYDLYLKRKKARKKTRRQIGKHNFKIGTRKIPRIPLKEF